MKWDEEVIVESSVGDDIGDDARNVVGVDAKINAGMCQRGQRVLNEALTEVDKYAGAINAEISNDLQQGEAQGDYSSSSGTQLVGNSYQIPRKNTQVPKILEIEGASKIDCHNCNLSGEEIESLRKQKDNQDNR